MRPCARYILVATLVASSGCGVLENPTAVNYANHHHHPPACYMTHPAIWATTPYDVLWVIDNSPSMCGRRQQIAEHIDAFVDRLDGSALDLHIAITTTHGPADPEAATSEPVAKFGHIQSTPQPVPSSRDACTRGAGVVEGQPTEFAPLRESLLASLTCLDDPADADMFAWTDAQIACALASPEEQAASGCTRTEALPDRNGDGAIDVFDLFPRASQYRTLPNVLVTNNYLNEALSLDGARIARDLRCMAMVGSRGDSFEKGLGAAIEAVTPTMTGGAYGLTGSDVARPNHGFIRKEAGFVLNLISDENDCTHDGSIDEARSVCGDSICDHYSATQPTPSPLLSPEVLALRLRENLAATKGIVPQALPEWSIIVSSTHGPSNLPEAPAPTCDGAESVARVPTCESSSGPAYAGDRYDRFIKSFAQHLPEGDAPPAEDLICADNFDPSLRWIERGEVFNDVRCAPTPVSSCVTDADCPKLLATERAGVCIRRGGSDAGFCDSSIALILERPAYVQGDDATYPDLHDHPYCVSPSLGDAADRCVVDPDRYIVTPCSFGLDGLRFELKDDRASALRDLAGYQLEIAYRPERGWETCSFAEFNHH